MDDLQPNSSISTAPPPPSEVKVRTMRSDIESMAKSGGGLPSFANIKVSGLDAPKVSETVVVRAQSKSNFFVIVLVIIIIAVVAVAGWFAYKIFLGSRQTTTTSQSQPVQQTAQTTASVATPTTTVPILALGATATGTATAPTTPFTHVSFFKTPADQILKLTLSATSTPQMYNKQLLTLLATANKNASVIEIDAKDASGNAASINELLATQNAQVLNPLTLASDFDPDATFFVYRDKNGFWPGYVIALAPGQSWVAVQSSVQQIESSQDAAAIPNLFLAAGASAATIGTPSTDGFTGSVIGSSTVRVLPFFGGTVPAYFVYGWTPDNQYLILSTSQNGFAAALTRLGY
jgi:cytoskeletal protein RodZ